MKIGLGLSGGGFRAASFNLGVLYYLNRIKIGDKPLLENVVALSTVSGGTITGARYSLGIKKGETFNDIYQSLYTFMSKENLIDLSIKRLLSNEGWNGRRVKSLINAFADVYNDHLFINEKFGRLMNLESNPIHLKHISFNATEFANALQFRFQISEKITNVKQNEPDKGIIGNSYFRLNDNVASEIRMADILAASSCFPAGFEPINFPTDFIFENKNIVKALATDFPYTIGLMDGGIVDNQGIEPLLLANERMKKNLKTSSSNTNNNENALDLLILSDVASPYLEGYTASVQKKSWLTTLSPSAIFIVNCVILLTALAGFYYIRLDNNIPLTIFLSVITTLSATLFLLGRFLMSLPSQFHVPKDFLKPIGKLFRLKIYIYQNLIMNRANSIIKLSMNVFLKHIRRLNYKRVYEDPSWRNRRIMNAIYELRTEEVLLQKKIENGTINADFIPSIAIQEVAKKAASMGTTLWFTKDELEDKMLDTLISCGQFTMCWNLLEYIQKIKKDPVNTNSSHATIISCEAKLMEDWKEFKKDPFWLFNDVGQYGKHK